ncbi:MAG: cellulase family glycosylhydrolase, partial [Lachnospiraceae bacterium]|nr:cellulase family glycosylhydrolase [Lachnospiraceae bacterium]
FAVPEDTAEDRLIVQVHAYSKVFSQAIEDDFILMETYSKQWRVPIVIGEFGTTTKYFEPSLRAVHASNYIARAAEHGIKCIWWDNGGDFGIINRTDYSKSDKEIIDALFLGLEGMKCELDNEIILANPENYTAGGVREKEIVVNQFWGSFTTDSEGEAIAIPKGSKCMLSLTAQGETSEVWLGNVVFYDKNGEIVPVTTNNVSRTTTTVKALFWTCDVPEEACSVRVSMYSPFTSIPGDVFNQSLQDGKLKLSISVFDLEDVYGTFIPIYSLQ